MIIQNWHKYSICLLLGVTLTFDYVFVKAYMNEYQTTVLINVWGEAHLELIMTNAIFILGCIVCYDLCRDRKKDIALCPNCETFYNFEKEEGITIVVCPSCFSLCYIDGDVYEKKYT